eukprot:TRINITY_DN3473_c0_g1_i1.p1 TRINITY_DN3473_c0_g1~~TRINITY_DN3473_c0_g1_i1.p1  ORF type:complete len:1648 (+),score=609.13 TRINITY_DN3473_c0_g1_i1:20-4963(+)
MSFFGSKKDKEQEQPISTGSGITTTGGRVDELVSALTSGANDDNPEVRQHIARAIITLGRQQPNLVLSTCKDFMVKNSKCDRQHRVILLTIIHSVMEFKRSEIDVPLAHELRQLAISEMSREKDVIPDWQGAASQVLVSLGMRFPKEVLEELMSRFSPGQLPHYFIMKSLGDFVIANPRDTVPKLKEVFARILPVLASVKQENLKWVFAAGIGHFCDAILTYVANFSDKDPNVPSLSVHAFSSDVFPAYEIMFNNWLLSKEPKVRLATIQALGSISAVLTREQLDAQLPQLIPNILNLYKKEKEHLPITQGFNSLLWVGAKDQNRSLETLNLLTPILAMIHPLTCQNPDPNNSSSIKNHNELLRVYQTIAIMYSDSLVSHLLSHLQGKESKYKLGTLAIIRHLITHAVDPLEDKRGVIVSGIKPLILTEQNLSIKYELCQIVIAMAHHGYLSLEGGETLVEFIVLNCSITDEQIAAWNAQKNKEGTSPLELRTLSDNILNLMTTTLHNVHEVLWPYLFEVLIPPKFSNSLAVVCKCLAWIGSLKREEEAEDYIIDFDRMVNLPKPPAIIARLIVMLNAPNRRGQLGLHIMSLLKAIGPALHPSICDMWDGAIPKMMQYLETKSGAGWQQAQWEELVQRLLVETIRIANDGEWTNALGEALAQHAAELYDTDHDMKRVAFKQLGTVLQKSSHKEFIRQKLEHMLAHTDPNNELERTGCAQGFGYCAAQHLDMTLERVQAPVARAAKKTAEKKEGGVFGLFSSSGPKDKAPAADAAAKGDLSPTVILCYGYISAYAAPSLITSRVDITILNQLKPTMLKAKNPVTRETIIKTIDLIAKAMHKNHLGKEYTLKQRDELLKLLMVYVTPNVKEKIEVPNSIRIAALNAAVSLINLDPVLPTELEKEVLDRITTFYSIPNPDAGSNKNPLIDALNDVLGAILFSQPTIETLGRLFKSVEPIISSADGVQRSNALQSLVYLLTKFIDLKKKGAAKSFTDVGRCIALLIPRVTDPVPSVRTTALSGIRTCLYIDFLLKQAPKDDSEETLPMPPILNNFDGMMERILADELNDQLTVTLELARLLAKTVAPEELPHLLMAALKGLTDSQSSSTSGTCVVLHGLIKMRGPELLPKVASLVQGIIGAMETITNETTLNGTLHALQSLATHHEIAVIDRILVFPLPHSPHVVKALQAIARNEDLVMPLINHLLETINNSQLYEENSNNGKITKVACQPAMAATCSLEELMQLEELEAIVVSNYSLFLSSIFLRIGTSNSMTPPSASEQAVNCLKQFLVATKDTAMQTALDRDGNAHKLTTPKYTDAITDLTSATAKGHRAEMAKIFKAMSGFMRGNFPEQRVVAATVIAEFVNNCKGDPQLLELLIGCMLAGLADPTVKLQSLKGLGNIVAVGKEEANNFASTILDALMSSIDDRDEIICQEAMKGLSKVFELVDSSRMAPIIVNIIHRIRPAFDKENDEIRAAAFTLFGALHRFGLDAAPEHFFEQIHNNLPSLVLHLNDDCDAVKNACRGALQKLGPLYRSEKFAALMDESLAEGKYYDYPEFLNDLSKVLIEDYTERVNYYVMTCKEYFGSNWNSIKANAATFIGFLLGNLPLNRRRATTINPGLISKALVNLLKEKDPRVRIACADAMSLLHDY